MKYVLIILSLAMVCCGPSKEELDARAAEEAAKTIAQETTPTVDSSAKVYCDNSHFIIGVYKVNDCEYISFVPNDRHSGEGVAVVHAGNCNNSIHSAHVTHTVEMDDKKPY